MSCCYLNILVLFAHIILHHQYSYSQKLYPQTETCGYQSCAPTIDGMLNVHIVCHTHLDAGWVETYDEYYYRYVRTIYTSVIKTLYESPNRKFIAVESSFFSRWFNEQTEIVQNRVHWLVRTGQLEFISGGWSMNDEAAAHYSAIIDNLTFGMRWLNNTFGRCAIPKIGWQIDPFGHSREQASIFAQMGFDGMFLGRIDYQDKQLRERTKTMEFIWKSSPSLGNKADIFAGVLPNIYWPPKGFCYDTNCIDETIGNSNAERIARDFIRMARSQSQTYSSNHTVITMGMDFFYRDSNKWFTNLDRLMAAVNALRDTENVNIIYSTPSCYLKALNQANKTWPVKVDDFFPYADDWNAYWTGYFTSRPSLKFHIKYGNSILQSMKQLQVLASMDSIHNRKQVPLQEAVAMLQHHDAITGTCKQYVNDDYTRILSKAILSGEELIADTYNTLLLNEGYITPTRHQFCNELNISQCAITERITNGSSIIVTIYNPLAHPVQHYMRLPVKNFRFRVRDASRGLLPVQIVPINAHIMSLPERNSIANSELIFQALLPPLGFASFSVNKINNNDPQTIIGSQESEITEKTQNLTEDIVLDNRKISVTIDARTGLLKSIGLKDGRHVPVSQNFHWYQAEDRFRGEKPSGAYAFNPTHQIPHQITKTVSYKIVRGVLVDEVHQTFNPWISQVIRIYRDYDYVEFDWVIGPIPIKHWAYNYGQEIITRYETQFETNGTFFTDSNGRETLRRVRNYRPTWDLETTEPVASNYYPITTWAFIRDYAQDLQLTVLPDRSEGGSSMADGMLEVMLHRRLLYDDAYGMEEALNEPGSDNNGLIVRGKHRLIVNTISESIRQMRTMSKTLTWKPLASFKHGSTPRISQSLRSSENINFVGLNHMLPKNIHILTLEKWDDERVLLRLENIYEINEDSQYSVPTEVSLRNLFTTFRIIEVKEMSLSALRQLEDVQRERFKWYPEFDPYEKYTSFYGRNIRSDKEIDTNENEENPLQNFTITLNPMEIKTFLLKIESRRNCPNTGFNVPRRHQQTRYNTNNIDC